MANTYLLSYFSKRYTILVIFMTAAFLAESTAAYALTPTQQQQNNRIQREQQIQQQEDTERSLNTGRPQTTIEVPTPSLQKGQGTGCRKIKRILLVDATHMSKEENDKLVAPYTRKCLGADDIEKLMSDVTSFYIKKGYVTTRIYLPAQDLSTGTLKIQIVPGKARHKSFGGLFEHAPRMWCRSGSSARR